MRVRFPSYAIALAGVCFFLRCTTIQGATADTEGREESEARMTLLKFKYRRAGAPALGEGSNMADASLFIEALTGNPDAQVTFQTFDDDSERKDKALARVLHGTLEEYAEELENLNTRGAGVFVMVNEGDGRGRTNENVILVRAVFVDLDGAPIEPVAGCPLPPHIIVESSRDKGHAYWRVSDCPLEQFRPIQQALAAKFNGDPSVHDLARVLRVPGFWHKKDPLKPWLAATCKLADGTRASTVAELGEGPNLKGAPPKG